MNEFEKKKLIKHLEALAKEVLQLKEERNQRRPIVIEFCGSPKSGKSTTISSLNIFLKRNNFKTIVLSERASVCPVSKKTHPFFNIWTLTSAIAELIGYLSTGKDRYDIIIADRAIFDALCWFEWLNSNDNNHNPYLDDDTYEILKNFALLDLWTNIIDIVYIFKVPPATSIQREYANLLTEARGSIMRENILSTFNVAIDNAKSKYSIHFREIKQIDTSEQQNNQNQVSYDVTQSILTTLKDLLMEKIGYFDASLRNSLKSGINPISLILKEQIYFGNREIVENGDFVQPIPIAVITNVEKNKVLVLKKNTKRTASNSPERDKLLVYLGGHLREEDFIDKSFVKAIKRGLHREIEEEINESVSINDSYSFLIYTPTTEKSRKHLAICHVITLDLDNKTFNPTPEEFIMKKGRSQSGRILRIDDLKDEFNDMEEWSKTILKEVFKIKFDPKLFE
jgi:predicted NUDIX family phosphoesterase